MTRRQFLLVASIVPGIFGSVMMLAPQLMLENSLTQPADEATSIVTRWVGFAVFATPGSRSSPAATTDHPPCEPF